MQAYQQHIQHGRRKTGSCNFFRWFSFAAILSQLLVFRYLSKRWPSLNHTYEPPTTTASSHISNNFNPPKDLNQNRAPDGSLDDIPLFYNTDTRRLPYTTVQCVGENFEPDNSWLFRSCKFQNVCFDTNAKEFVFVQSPTERALKDTFLRASSKEFIAISSLAKEESKFSLGPIHFETSPQEEESLRWFPKIIQRDEMPTTGFYELPSNIVLVPFRAALEKKDASLAQVLWDTFFPIYTLLFIFKLTPKEGMKMFPIQHLVATQTEVKMGSMHILQLLTGQYNHQLVSTSNFHVQPQQLRSNLICARTAVAGLGIIADRGFHLPERWRTKNPAIPPAALHAISVNLSTHNVAQGIVLKQFRDFMLDNLGFPTTATESQGIQITFYSTQQSEIHQQIMTKLASAKTDMKVSSLERSLVDSSSSLSETIKGIAESSVLIVDCCSQEAALAAALLPLGSTLVILLDEQKQGGMSAEEVKMNSWTWELLDNAGYIRTHWLTKDGEGTVVDQVVQTIRSELHALMSR